MCIVQINANLGVSCAVNVSDNMTVYTNNKRVRDARESVLEFLLINHPLDCPICDQGGDVTYKIFLLCLVLIEVDFMKKKKEV
jgi:NADH-quinone oxidoreductase subunit G